MDNAAITQSFRKLVSYRAGLLTGLESSRAGQRLPGLEDSLRRWCFHSRSRRDFALLMLEGHIRSKFHSFSSLLKSLGVSRNTLKQIISEAASWFIIVETEEGYAATEQFYLAHLMAYFKEWQLMEKGSSEAVAKTFKFLSGDAFDLEDREAIKLCLDLAVISRADSVKADRTLRLSQAQVDRVDLSSWVTLNAYNRDLLLLVMDANISSKPVTIKFCTATLSVSRNSVLESLVKGVKGGFLEQKNSGYQATDEALQSYLQWHLDAFSQYDKKYLSAMSVFHSRLHNNEFSKAVFDGS